MSRLHPLLAVLRQLVGALLQLAGRGWRGVRPHVVTAVAFGLLSYGVAQIYVPAGLIAAAVCLVALERKVEADRQLR